MENCIVLQWGRYSCIEIATALTSAQSNLFYTHPRVPTLQLWFILTSIMSGVGVSPNCMRVLGAEHVWLAEPLPVYQLLHPALTPSWSPEYPPLQRRLEPTGRLTGWGKLAPTAPV